MFTNYARVGTCLPARTRLAPGRGRAASCRFADIGRLVGRLPDLVIYSAASSAGERASSTSSPHISCGRCSAMPPRRIWSPTVLQSARAKCQQRQQTLHLLRQMQPHAVEPEVDTYSAAISACERASSISRPGTSCGGCGALPSFRTWSRTALPSARAKVTAASAGLTSLAAVAASCHRAGGGHLQCCHQRARKCQQH